VGPHSAGAVPGPACYGRGGRLATVTDANVVAGRIPANLEFPGLGRLDPTAARQAIDEAGVSAEGILEVVNANMVRALRRVSVERGVDPRGLALVAFGGAGPLHGCALADALGMSAVIVPARAGVLSAAGMLAAPRQVDLVMSWKEPRDHEGATGAAAELAAEARRRLADPGAVQGAGRRRLADPGAIEVETLLDCRYAGQGHEISVSAIDDFHDEHKRRNGFARVDTPVEVVALRASARMASPISLADLPDPGGRAGTVVGPEVIAEPDCTIWVAEGWTASVGGGGAWVLTR
jgi:N-methylhydantoinase A/oxoprolinase/acetone carboxylase beta subunit